MNIQARNHSGKRPRTASYILIGDGFDELEVVLFLHAFRQAGLSIKSVSLFNKLVYSRQGVGLKADYELSERPFDPTQDCLLILPTGGHNENSLRRDARVKTLLQGVARGRAHVAVTDGQSLLADDVGRLMKQRPAIRPYGGQNLQEFVNRLTDQVGLAV